MTIEFKDLLTTHVFANITSISVPDVFISMATALLLGMFICLIYKNAFSGVMYSYNFSLSLIALTMISTMIVMVVTSNILLSVGMVGSLSIVRFRTVVKEPLDIIYLFWAITTGVVIAGGMYVLAVLGDLIVGLTLYVLSNKRRPNPPYILILRCTEESEDSSIDFIKSKVSKMVTKGKTIQDNIVEYQLEIKLNKGDTKFINELNKKNGVKNTSLISYNGEYLG